MKLSFLTAIAIAIGMTVYLTVHGQPAIKARQSSYDFTPVLVDSAAGTDSKTSHVQTGLNTDANTNVSPGQLNTNSSTTNVTASGGQQTQVTVNGQQATVPANGSYSRTLRNGASSTSVNVESRQEDDTTLTVNVSSNSRAGP